MQRGEHRVITALLALMLLLGLIRSVRGGDFNVEGTTLGSDVVARVRITGAGPDPTSTDSSFLSAEVREAFKGTPGKTISIHCLFGGVDAARKFAAMAPEGIIFLGNSASGAANKFEAGVWCGEGELPGNDVAVLRDLELKPLRTDEEIAAHIRAEISRPGSATRPTILLEVRGADDFIAMRVPYDEDRLKRVIPIWAHSAESGVRRLACAAVGQVDVPGRVELLKGLLSDDALTPVYRRYGPWTHRVYYVRVEAVQALLNLKEQVPANTRTVDDVSPYTRVPLAWPLWIPPAAFFGIYIFWRRRHEIGASFAAAFALTLTLLTLALGAAWIRSDFTADDFFYSGYTHILSATVYKGTLQLIHVPDFHEDQALCHGTLRPDYTGVLMLPDKYFWHQFGSSNDSIAASSEAELFNWSINGNAHFNDDPSEPAGGGLNHAQRLVVPFRYFVPLIALLPLVWFAARCRRAYLAEQRRRHGLCPVCGYDLRASPQRCPECGTESGAVRVKAAP